MSDDEETVVRRRLRWLAAEPQPAGDLPPVGDGYPAVPAAVGAAIPVVQSERRQAPTGGRPVEWPTVRQPEGQSAPASGPEVARPVPWPGQAGSEPPRRRAPGSRRSPDRRRASGGPWAEWSPPIGPFTGPAPSSEADVPGSSGGRLRGGSGPGDEPTSEERPSRLPGPGAFDPGRRGVRALAAVAVAVVLDAGLWAWQSRPQAEPVGAAPSVTPGSGVPGEAQPADAGPTPGGELVVAVAGKVRRPGLVRLPAGSRVADAVQAAGGALPGADVALLNPARKITDGELILVGAAAPAGQPGAAPVVPGANPPAAGNLINLNTATLAQLDTLPGVGPVLAQRILTHRDQHGGFRSVGDLRQVEGIGDARYEQLKELVTV